MRLIAAIAMALVSSLALAGGASAAKTTCPNTFQVLHDDHVGKLSLPAGHYTIKVFNENKLSCDQAARNFAKFLQDFDGVLPDGWRVRANRSTFQQSEKVGFKVKQAEGPSGGGGGSHPATGDTACPNTFTVEHDDMIGKLSLPAGKYLITVLDGSTLSCTKAATKFQQFLQDTDGVLPGSWVLKARTATFTKGKNGFRVKPAK